MDTLALLRGLPQRLGVRMWRARPYDNIWAREEEEDTGTARFEAARGTRSDMTGLDATLETWRAYCTHDTNRVAADS